MRYDFKKFLLLARYRFIKYSHFFKYYAIFGIILSVGLLLRGLKVEFDGKSDFNYILMYVVAIVIQVVLVLFIWLGLSGFEKPERYSSEYENTLKSVQTFDGKYDILDFRNDSDVEH